MKKQVTEYIDVCDHPSHDVDATAIGSVSIQDDTEQRVVDLCHEHMAYAAKLDLFMWGQAKAPATKKGLKQFTAASGALFTTAEAREWAYDRGVWPVAKGRLPNFVIEMYAEEH